VGFCIVVLPLEPVIAADGAATFDFPELPVDKVEEDNCLSVASGEVDSC
jgi:hypothetical protein